MCYTDRNADATHARRIISNRDDAPFFIMSNKLLTVFNGATVNPLASVPWVAQWKFNNDGNDSIGSNTLTNNNSATFTTGKLGGATGATQLVAASSQYWSKAISLDVTGGVWISGWYYANSIPNNGIILGLASPAFPRVIWYQILTNSVIRMLVRNSANTSDKTFDVGSVSTSTWFWFAGGYDATAQTVWGRLNGSAVSRAAWTQGILSPSNNVYVSSSYGHLDGQVDNLTLATGAEPSTAILDALYNSGNGTETLT